MKITKRPIYEYECQGPCGETRKTLVADRAIEGWCTKCRRNRPDENQQELFREVEVEKPSHMPVPIQPSARWRPSVKEVEKWSKDI